MLLGFVLIPFRLILFSFYIFWQRHHENRKGHDSFYEKVSKMKIFKFISSSRILILLCVIDKRLLFLGPTRWAAYSSHGPFMKKRILKKWVTFNCESFAVFLPRLYTKWAPFCVALKMECCDLQLAFWILSFPLSFVLFFSVVYYVVHF